MATTDRDFDPDMLKQMTYCKVIPLPHGPGSTLPLFVCKAGHPESVTVFFNQAQGNSSSVVLSTNPIAGVMLFLLLFLLVFHHSVI